MSQYVIRWCTCLTVAGAQGPTV